MESKFCFVFLLVFCTGVQSATVLEKSYEYLMNLGKNLAPTFMSMINCVGEEEPWGCAREKAGKMLDAWGEDVEKDRRIWEEEADAEIRTSGRSIEEMPSKIGREVIDSMGSLANIIERGVARALEGKKHESGGIDSITISTGGGNKKMKKKKPKPPRIHLVHPMIIKKAHKEEKGRTFGNGVQSWVIGERSLPEAFNSTSEESDPSLGAPVEEGRGIFTQMWDMGQETLDSMAEQVVEAEDKENGIDGGKQSVAVTVQSGVGTSQNISQFTINTSGHVEATQNFNGTHPIKKQRGKKKKKKKAILKLLVLGAVIKAKIATLLQILNYKLQTKFFLIALLNFVINIASLWLEYKRSTPTTTTPTPPKEWRKHTYARNRESKRPQCDSKHRNIIYYEHAQHQHHYDHEEEEPSHGWGPWSRSIFPTDDSELEASDDPSPYRAQEKAPLIYSRPYLSRA